MKTKHKIYLAIFSFFISSHSLAQTNNNTREWEELSPQEQEQFAMESYKNLLDPKIKEFAIKNNIALKDLENHSFYLLDNGEYSFELPNNEVESDPVDNIMINFLNIFKGARLYYNITHSKTNVCLDPNLQECSTRPFQNNQGDYYIESLENDNNAFKIRVNNRIYYIDTVTMISNFDFYDFYELPQRFKQNENDQKEAFLNNIVGFDFIINSGTYTLCDQGNNNYELLPYSCDSSFNYLERDTEFQINSYRGNNINTRINGKNVFIDRNFFLEEQQDGLILRKTY